MKYTGAHKVIVNMSDSFGELRGYVLNKAINILSAIRLSLIKLNTNFLDPESILQVWFQNLLENSL